MSARRARLARFALVPPLALVANLVAAATPPAEVQGRFLVGGADAGLRHARAARVELEPGKPGWAILLSAEPAAGAIDSWRTADPRERGSFVVLLLEEKGAVWVAELGHAAAKSGRFGVVTEVQVTGLAAAGGRLSGQLVTPGEQSFGDDLFSIDLKFDAPLEK